MWIAVNNKSLKIWTKSWTLKTWKLQKRNDKKPNITTKEKKSIF